MFLMFVTHISWHIVAALIVIQLRKHFESKCIPYPGCSCDLSFTAKSGPIFLFGVSGFVCLYLLCNYTGLVSEFGDNRTTIRMPSARLTSGRLNFPRLPSARSPRVGGPRLCAARSPSLPREQAGTLMMHPPHQKSGARGEDAVVVQGQVHVGTELAGRVVVHGEQL